MNETKRIPEMTNNIKILVVDKDANMLEICRDVLEREGYIVQTTSSIDGLIARLLSKPPEVLLLDLEMPEIDSSTLFHEIQQTAPDCCIIGMSVRESHALVEAVRRQEICDYLIKPFSIEQLKVSVYRCLKRLKLMKRKEEFDTRVGKVRNYLCNVASNLEKLSENEDCSRQYTLMRVSRKIEK